MKKTPTKKKASIERRYSTTWRNKFLTIEAKSLGEMITSLEGAVSELKVMQKDGVVLDADGGGVEDDYAQLVTTDAKVAKKHGMTRESETY
jgi:hypothetical protein